MSRRDFLKTAAVTAGLSILSPRQKLLGESPQPEAATQPTGPFSFCVVADPHCSEQPKPGIEEYGNGVDKFFACLDAIKKLTGPDQPDFVLIAGDVHLWTLKEYLPKIDIPLHVIAGNHESNAARRKQMRDLFPDDFRINGQPADYYSFVHKGVRFIGLCDAGMGDHVGQLCSEIIRPSGQCEWLERQLTQGEAQKILFAHIPPDPEGRDRIMCMSRNDSRWFNALIARTQPTALFFGHQHRATVEHKIGRTRSFTLRSCCWNSGKAPLGFLHVRITDQGITTREILTGTYT